MGLIVKQHYIVVGFDPGLADTGFGVIEVKGDKLTCLDYGVVLQGGRDIK